jgi:hypothetical protein
MTHKYSPINHQKAIWTYPNGFCFGGSILELKSDTKLNNQNEGECKTGKDTYYEINCDVSPLTNQKDRFTCAQLEVYKVFYQ